MANGSRSQDSDRGETTPGVPRWVKVAALVALVVVGVLVVVMLSTSGEHGPGLHTGDPTGSVASTVVGGS